MAEMYSVAVESRKILYFLGTISSARLVFPLILNREIGECSFILYGDETNARYADEVEFEKEFKRIDYDSYGTADNSFVMKHEMSEEVFRKLFDLVCGKSSNRITTQQFLESEGA